MMKTTITVTMLLLFMPPCTEAWSSTSTNVNHHVKRMASLIPSSPPLSTTASSSPYLKSRAATASARKSQTNLQMMMISPDTTTTTLLFESSSSIMLSANAAKSILYDIISSLAPIFGNSMYDLAISTTSLPNLVALLLVLFGATPFIYVAAFGVGKFVTSVTGGDIANLNDDDDDDVAKEESIPLSSSSFQTSSSSQSFPSSIPPSRSSNIEEYTPPPPTYLPSYNMPSIPTSDSPKEEEEEEVEYLDLRENKTFATISLLLLSIPLYMIVQPITFYNLFYSLSIKLDNVGIGNGLLGNSAFGAASNADKISYVFTLAVFSFVSYGIVSAFIYGSNGKKK